MAQQTNIHTTYTSHIHVFHYYHAVAWNTDNPCVLLIWRDPPKFMSVGKMLHMLEMLCFYAETWSTCTWLFGDPHGPDNSFPMEPIYKLSESMEDKHNFKKSWFKPLKIGVWFCSCFLVNGRVWGIYIPVFVPCAPIDFSQKKFSQRELDPNWNRRMWPSWTPSRTGLGGGVEVVVEGFYQRFVYMVKKEKT